MTFPAAVESWRSLFASAACDLPTDFILRWIERESAGLPCNLETATGQDEIGLLQIMVPNDTSLIGIDESTLRQHCNGQSTTADWNSDDINIAVSSSVAYIRALRDLAHAYLQSVGTDWDESTPDFWSLVRLMHAEGIHQQSRLQDAASTLGRPPSSWDEFVMNSSHSTHWVNVAADDGAYAAGFSPSCTNWIALGFGLVGLALGVWLYRRQELSAV